MKHNLLIRPLLFVAMLLVVISGCEKDHDDNVPVLSTAEVKEITSNTATSGGNITHDGGITVTARGVCWSTGETPTIYDNITEDGAGAGSFTSSITDLEPNTTYFLRAYATNSAVTAYGIAMSFSTEETVPVLSTTEITEINKTTATSGGNIVDDGGATVIVRGVCWSTSAGPTINDNITEDGTGAGSFSSSITDLLPNTTYYLRAYATNSAGTGYGSSMSFTTLQGVSVVATKEVSAITSISAISGGNITDDGGATITKRGVCWGTTDEPTINDNKTEDGTGAGSFTSSITDLESNTTYYLRAYATNSAGTAYGSAISFTTEEGISFDTFTDPRGGKVYQTVTIGDQEWFAENLAYLPEVHSNAEFRTAGETKQPGYGVYGYDGSDVVTAKAQTNYSTYGVLYNWFAVNTDDVCPTGWHVPSDAEWDELEMAHGMSGFSSLPGGYRGRYGAFLGVGDYGGWWSATEGGASGAWGRGMYDSHSHMEGDFGNKELGFSVRCLRD